jgi:hypothetical protein
LSRTNAPPYFAPRGFNDEAYDVFNDGNRSKGFFSDENLGLFITLYVAMAFESMENSELLIELFRKNSGKNQGSYEYGRASNKGQLS